ncbi:MAG: bifunctional precorrin-2 dehydrogenase/sirohydrochlorin ferrochelatase [Calditrichota bacterium]
MYLPLFFKSETLNVLIIGGGQVAARKAENLLRLGCRITLIAPEFVSDIEALRSHPTLILLNRKYQTCDSAGYNLIIAATDNRSLNRMVFEEAVSRGTPVNVVDDPELCTVIFPAVWREGPLEVAVGTGGKAPFLAAAVRDLAQERLSGLGRWVEIGTRFRWIVKQEIEDSTKRDELLKRFVKIVPSDYYGPAPQNESLDEWLNWMNNIKSDYDHE